MPVDDQVQLTDTGKLTPVERRLKRERLARAEAERISERVTRELYDRGKELELLSSVSRAANEAQTLEDAFQVALDGICEHTGWDVGHAFLTDDDGVMVSADLWHLSSPDRFAEFKRLTEVARFREGEGLPGRVLEARAPVWIEDVQEDYNFPRAQHAKDLGVHAGFGFPILVGDEVTAALEFFTPVVVPPNKEFIRLAEQISLQLGRVVERVRAEHRLSHQATHDSLTGLPNRVLILEHLGFALARLKRQENVEHAVLFIDLDGFKQVNDTIGHAAGDQVLKEVARRLQLVGRKSDVLGRLSGDEFVLLCGELPGSYSATRICRRLFEAFDEDFVIGDEQFRLSASVGVTFCRPDDDVTAEQLIKRADAAMYRAKKQSGPAFTVFDESVEEAISVRLSMESALRRAIQTEELFLVYQPEVDTRNGRVVGVEALVRWQREDQVVLPAEFIPMAEETGIIVPMGAWVVETACRQTAEWCRRLGQDEAPWVSVNLSVRQLADPSTLRTVASALERYPECVGKVFFEVTESVLLDDAESGLKVLSELKDLGTEIAIDDFGTGYASLSYLRRFPASAVKIDRSFVWELESNPASLAIVSSVVDLAHALGLQAVAEGVESRQQLEILKHLGCDLVQGYFLARPQKAHQLDRLLEPDYRAWSTDSSSATTSPSSLTSARLS